MTIKAIASLNLVVVLLASAATAAENDPEGAVGLSPDDSSQQCNVVGACPAAAENNGDAHVRDGLIWQTNFMEGTLELLDTNANCNVLASCPAPGDNRPSENAWDGQYLYHYDFGTGQIYQIDTRNCEVLSSCDAPGDDLAEGLTFDGQTFWKGDSQWLYRFTYGPNGCEVVGRCPNPPDDSADGLAVCGEFLVMLGYSGRVHQIRLTDCELVASCELNIGPEGNGAASDEVSILWMGNDNSTIDILEADCSVPVPVEESTWGTLKSTFRD